MILVIQVPPQRGPNDCAISCLSGISGQSYERTLLAFGDDLAHGAQMRQVKAAARRLGLHLTLKRKIDLEQDTGLLAIRSKKWKTDHLVVLNGGCVLDTDGSTWFDPDLFLTTHDAKVLSLLVPDESRERATR